VNQHTVLIAAPELLPALKARLADESQELQAFTDAEALRALEIITTRRPPLVLLERKFGSSPRGAALINRIKADPSLVDTEIRVIAPDGKNLDPVEPPPAAPVKAKGKAGSKGAGHAVPVPPEVKEAAPLDYRGTRRAPRFRLSDSKEILVDGNRGTLVDLSTLGAQLVTGTVLKPNQKVRISLADEDRPMRCTATVVWASFEIPAGSTPRYRAGLDFIEPDAGALDAFIRRHGA
jgi:hypothetical protein